MKIYQVGGCVRDSILGLEPKDIDYVVVGGTAEMMEEFGFSKVGAAFPVFIHPVTGCEFALARKERKVGVGYNGFDVVFDSSVTLEEDLSRRDLTINAMAQDTTTGEIIDPFGGREDLKHGVLRHVSDAFAEDPIRVLRTARFAARYNFKIHPDTLSLMRKVAPELNAVPQERIWAEIEKGLTEQHPVRMFWMLHDCGALQQQAMAIYQGADADMLTAITNDTPFRVRFCAIASKFNTKQDFETHRIPTDCARVALAFNKVMETLWSYHHQGVDARIEMFKRIRAFSSSNWLDDVLAAFALTKAKGFEVEAITKQVREDFAKASSVNTTEIAASSPKHEIERRITAARVAAINQG